MLNNLLHSNERGDTIIEVLLAFTVFSMVAVGAITLMNQGTQSAQKALEITLVRQQIDAQAETLRFVQDKAVNDSSGTYSQMWQKMTTLAPGYAVSADSTTQLSVQNDGSCPARSPNAFIMDAHNAELKKDGVFNDQGAPGEAPYPHAYYDATTSRLIGATGIWIEAAKASTNSAFVDFAIKTCWYAPGNGPATILGTIVRLYAPN